MTCLTFIVIGWADGVAYYQVKAILHVVVIYLFIYFNYLFLDMYVTRSPNLGYADMVT